MADIVQCSASSDSEKVAVNTTNVVSSTASPGSDSNSEQVIKQERSNPQCSKLCTGLQHVSQLSTNNLIHNLQAHSGNNDLSLNSLPNLECSDQVHSSTHLKAPQGSECEEGTWREQSWHHGDMIQGLFSCTSNDVFRAFCEFSIQETCYQPEKQRLVPNCPITQIGFHKCEHTYYMRTEPNAFDKPELYIKPFIGLAPDHDNFYFSDCEEF